MGRCSPSSGALPGAAEQTPGDQVGAPSGSAPTPQQPGGAPRGLRRDPAAAARGTRAGTAAAARRAWPRQGARRGVQGQVSVPECPLNPLGLRRPLHSPPIAPCSPAWAAPAADPTPATPAASWRNSRLCLCPQVFPHIALCPHPVCPQPYVPTMSLGLLVSSCPHISGPSHLYVLTSSHCLVPLSPCPPYVPISSCPHIPMSPISLPVLMSPNTHVLPVAMSPSLLSPFPCPCVPHPQVPTSPRLPSPHSPCPHVPHPRFSVCPCAPILVSPCPGMRRRSTTAQRRRTSLSCSKRWGDPDTEGAAGGSLGMLGTEG